MPSSIERLPNRLPNYCIASYLSFPASVSEFKNLKRSEVVKMITSVLGNPETIGSLEDAGRLAKKYQDQQWTDVFDRIENKKYRNLPAVIGEYYVSFADYVNALGKFYGPFKPE